MTVVILNGTASAGKTSIAFALQEVMDEPYFEVGLDRFLGGLPRRYFTRPRWDEVMGRWSEPGPLGARLVPAMHRAIAALGAGGVNVVADHVLIDPSWAADLARTMREVPAVLVGVRCELRVVVDRERARGDRTLGEAAAQYDLVHRHGAYDLEVDTGELTPAECAERIRLLLESGQPPQALRSVAREAGPLGR